MSIRIVTHAYAKSLPQFAVFLRAQLSSLVRCSCDVPARITVCCAAGDQHVMQVLQDFGPLLNGRLHAMVLPEAELFRRSIGRNQAALGCQEEVIWYTDVDHYFGPQCLNELWDTFRTINVNHDIHQPSIVWPDELMIHRDHLIGDAYWTSHLHSRGVIEINPNDFEPKKYNSPIGGVQIVRGAFARRYGYLNGHRKWLQPRTDGKPFGDFRDDVRFRRSCMRLGPGFSIPLPNLFRLRHTKVTYKG